MSSSALRAAWEAAQKPEQEGGALRAAWEAAQPKRDGNVIERGLKGAAEGLANIAAHPIESAESMVVGPIKSAFNAAIAPSVGDRRPDPRLSKGGNSSGAPIDRSAYDEEHGAVTPRERAEAGVATVANAAFPSVFGKISGMAPGRLVGRVAGLAGGGAMVGAANNPDDPGAGAISGGIVTPLLGAVTEPVVKGANKVGELNSVRRQVKNAAPLDKRAIELDREIEGATRANYGQAEAEGAAGGGTSPALQKALEHPRVAKFVELVRGGDEGAAMSDADVARSAYKLMSKQRRGLKSQMEVSGYDAAKDLEAERIGNAMKQLKDATAAASQKPPITLDIAGENTVATGPHSVPGEPNIFGLPTHTKVPGVEIETPSMRIETAPAEDVGPLMPSFPRAVAEKARMEGERSAFNEGSDAAKRIMRGTSIPGKRLVDKSPEAFRVKERTPGEAIKAKEGVLGRAKEEVGFKPKTTLWQSIVGLGDPINRLNKLSPFLDALDQQAGKSPRQQLEVEQILKAMGLVNAPLSNQP